MRRSTIYWMFILVGGLFLAFLLVLHPFSPGGAGGREALMEKRRVVARLGLTDLCLFTEARYTRHPSQADLHSAFQDHPSALDHFPSGSLVSPPRSLRGIGLDVD